MGGELAHPASANNAIAQPTRRNTLITHAPFIRMITNPTHVTITTRWNTHPDLRRMGKAQRAHQTKAVNAIAAAPF
ncbi:hypothetical protein JCM17961_45330 [Endothiovibrio diazotrophicus]